MAAKALMEERDGIEAEIEMLMADLTSPGANGEAPAGLKGGRGSADVDAEGFPRADVDLYEVKRKRHRLNCLQSDFKDVMRRIEALVFSGGGGGGGGGGATAGASAVAGSEQVQSDGLPSVASIFAAAGVSVPGHIQAADVTATAAAAAAAAAVPVVAGPSAAAAARTAAAAPVARAAAEDGPSEPFATVDEVSPGGPAAAAGLRVGDAILRFGTVHAANHQKLRALAQVVGASIGQPVRVAVRRAMGAGTTTLELLLVPEPWSGAGMLGCHLLPMAGQ